MKLIKISDLVGSTDKRKQWIWHYKHLHTYATCTYTCRILS